MLLLANYIVIREISLQGKIIRYSISTSSRSRYLRLAIHPDGKITVTAPLRAGETLIERFIRSKATWIDKHLSRLEKNPKTILSTNPRRDFAIYKDNALLLVEKRLAHFNTFYNLAWSSVTIRNQKTRWGSCSKSGALSFNYKIILLDDALCDYIIVHELCHLQEFNHSPNFWKLVEKTIPDYIILRKQIKQLQ